MKKFNSNGLPCAYRDGCLSVKNWLLNCYDNRVKTLCEVTKGCKSKPKILAGRVGCIVGIIESEIRPNNGDIYADYLLDLVIDLTH